VPQLVVALDFPETNTILVLVMFTTAIIAFREFLEAFLIIGVFLGVSRKLGLKKETEIGIAAIVGIVISFILSLGTYAFGDAARKILTEERAELLENYLMLFSGIFLAYVIFSLHRRISENKKDVIKKATNKLEKQAFDLSLFATIIFLVSREGFEIALFTASTSLFAVFFQNMLGLFIGFGLAAVLGTVAFLAYTKFPIQKVFRVTEYMIMLLGASLAQVGITELLEHQFNFHLADIGSFGMSFMPDEHSVIGHFIRSFTGIDAEFSLPRLLIMIAYIAGIFVFTKQNKHRKEVSEKH
jgi:high-affinity iron transporter